MKIYRKTSTYILTGSVRMMAVTDDSIARLATRDEFINLYLYTLKKNVCLFFMCLVRALDKSSNFSWQIPWFKRTSK
jgi:hypothetical protein